MMGLTIHPLLPADFLEQMSDPACLAFRYWEN